jgi:DNA-binding transcriptional MerR regulator
VSDLALSAGIKPDTVRFYEKLGLIPKPNRTVSGYRTYPPDTVKRVRFIRRAQALGFTLAEIGQILRLRESGKPPCDSVIRMAEDHLRATDRELAKLKSFRDALFRYVRQWKRMANPDVCAASTFCNLIEELVIEGIDVQRPAPRRRRRES